MAALIKAGLRLAFVFAIWLALSIWLGWARLPIAPGHVTSGPNRGLEQVIGTLWWLGAASVISLSAKTAVALLRVLDKSDRQRAARFTLDTIAIAVYLGAFISMSAFVYDLPVSTLFATSSIVAVILGFALQATVSDLLAGVALTVEQPFRRGDWITVDGRFFGRVTDMNWRATQLELKSGDQLILPNNMLNRSNIINHDAPKRAHRSAVDVILRYDDAPDHASEVLRAAALTVPNVLHAPAPKVEIGAFAEGTVTYRVKYWIARTSEENEIASAVRHAAYKHVSWAGLHWPEPRYIGIGPSRNGHDRNGHAEHHEDLAALLARVPLLALLDPDERTRLASGLRLQRIKQKTRLIRQGESGRSLFIIREGVLRVMVSDGHNDREMAKLQPGDFLGEASLLTGAARNASIDALTDAAVYEIDKDALAPLIADRSSLADQLGAMMAERERSREASLATNGSTKAATSSFANVASQIRAFFASD